MDGDGEAAEGEGGVEDEAGGDACGHFRAREGSLREGGAGEKQHVGSRAELAEGHDAGKGGEFQGRVHWRAARM